MMKLFNIFKKKIACKHKYKDFPWYITYESHDSGLFCDIKIVEPYVCLLCKHRNDKTLAVIKDVYHTDIAAKIRQLQEEYGKKVKDIAIVEDMINDFQLVDRSFVEAYEYSQKITEDIMKSTYEEKPASNGSNNNDLLALINEIKNNLQVTQKG